MASARRFRPGILYPALLLLLAPMAARAAERDTAAKVDAALGKALPDLASIPKSLASNPANKVSDVSRSTRNGADILSLTVADASKTLYMRCIQTPGARYTLTIEFPNTYRELVAANKDRFFESFKLREKS